MIKYLAAGAFVALSVAACGSSTVTPSQSSTALPQTAAPVATPVPTADPIIAYSAVNIKDASLFETVTAAESADCGAALLIPCQTDAANVASTAQTWLSDLSAIPVPASYLQGDGLLRQALGLYVSGSALQVTGISDLNSDEITAGTAEVDRATALLAQATALIPAAPATAS